MIKKSPIYRVGSKAKHITKLIRLMPNNIATFHDVFGGSGVVAINTNAMHKRLNEYDAVTYGIIDYLKNTDNNLIENHFNDFMKNVQTEQIKLLALAKKNILKQMMLSTFGI
jgi:site-specific DNA-adenine methylase